MDAYWSIQSWHLESSGDGWVTIRYTSTITTVTGQRDVSRSSVNGLKRQSEGKVILCQCSNHFWNLPCVYPCVGSMNESYNIIWITSPEWDVFLFIYLTVLLYCRSEHCTGQIWIAQSNERATNKNSTL